MSESMQQQMQRIENKLDKLLEEKKDDRPNSYYKIADENGNPNPCTRELLKEMKKGNKHNGLKTRSVQSIMEDHGFEYSSEGTRNVMKRLDRHYSKVKYHNRVGAKGSELQWHPDN